MSYILADGWLITMNERREILESASVCVEKDRIAAVGTRQQLQQRFPAAEVVDCKGRIVMPGMVNTHTHLFQTLLKGLGDDMVLKKWFTCMTGPSGVHLTPEDAHAAALHGCVESIRSGRDDARGFHVRAHAPGNDQVSGGRVRPDRDARVCVPWLYLRSASSMAFRASIDRRAGARASATRASRCGATTSPADECRWASRRT